MAWEIDRFKVKPAGILAAWREARVLVDENGTVTVAPVPGKPFPNLPCLQDYNKVSRRYVQDQIITEYCNTNTFTKFIIKAQDCTPFAYATTEINSPGCGYLTPLPTPYVPPNPFPDPGYALYKFFNDCTEDFVPFVANIYKKNYIGAATEILVGASSTVVYNVQNQSDGKFGQIRGKECNISFVAETNFEHSELYRSDEREYLVEILLNGVLDFKGYLIPDNASELFVAPPYYVNLRATDGLGALQNVTYPMPIGVDINLRQTLLSVLCYCLAKTNLGLDIRTICNLYEKTMANGIDDDPLNQGAINPLRFTKGNTPLNCFEVLQEVCKVFGAYLVQDKGEWKFVRISELSNTAIRSRLYDATGRFIRSENVNNLRTAGKDEEILLINHNHVQIIQNAYKIVRVRLLLGASPAIVYNGNFETWDGFNFSYWTKVGGVNISRIQKQIQGNGGALIPLDDYAVQFNQKADPGRYLQANPITVYTGDKLRFGFSFYADLTRIAPVFKVRFKLGPYYYFLGFGDSEPGWVQQIATASIYFQVNRIPQQYAFYKFEIELPEAPTDGDLYIQLFGAEDVRSPQPPYSPVQIDDVFVTRATSESNEPTGYIYTSQQLKFFTESPDNAEVIMGDYSESATLRLRPGNIQNQVAQNNLYALYTSDGSYSKSWYEYGIPGTEAPICQLLARAILKAYQEAFIRFEGDFQGQNISYTDVFNIILDGYPDFSSKLFAISSATFDIKKNQMTQCTLFEIFDKTINPIEISQPEYQGNVGDVEIIQNPDAPQDLAGVGVFTDEFTQEFV